MCKNTFSLAVTWALIIFQPAQPMEHKSDQCPREFIFIVRNDENANKLALAVSDNSGKSLFNPEMVTRPALDPQFAESASFFCFSCKETTLQFTDKLRIENFPLKFSIVHWNQSFSGIFSIEINHNEDIKKIEIDAKKTKDGLLEYVATIFNSKNKQVKEFTNE